MFTYIVLLYCVVLCCVVLSCVALRCGCVALCCVVLYCIVLSCIVLYCIVLYCIVLFCFFVLCYDMLCLLCYIYKSLHIHRISSQDNHPAYALAGSSSRSSRSGCFAGGALCHLRRRGLGGNLQTTWLVFTAVEGRSLSYLYQK